MSIRVYNTLSRQKEDFKPVVEGQASIYVCGVTTYDYNHIGHGRASVVFDMIARHLRYRNYDVNYVRNYTDVDDKIIRAAQKEGCEALELSSRFVEAAREDMLRLGCLPPNEEPLVSTHISQIIQFVSDLIEKGKAYAADNGDVYYSVASFEGYGKLSGKKVEDLRSGVRVDVIEAKRDPTDFALWKAAKPGEPSWESPWGPGRPGWHIECSTMCREHVGDTVDIHGGGTDLIFPHHENEVAQSEGLTGRPLAKYWMHNAMLTINNEKMSKSLNNFITIREILKKYHSDAVRLYYLNTHHRSPIDFSDDSLAQAEIALERLYMAKAVARRIVAADERFSTHLEGLDQASGCAAGGGTCAEMVGEALKNLPEGKLSKAEVALRDLLQSALTRVDEAMDDDFNSARALGVMFELARAILRYNTSHRKPTANGVALMYPALGLLQGICSTRLGLMADDCISFQTGLNQRRLVGRGITEAEVEVMVKARRVARDQKDWAEADRLRDALAKYDISLEDASDKTIWRVAAAGLGME